MTPSEQLPQTDHTTTEPAAEFVKDPSIAAGHSRRTFLFKLALMVNGAVGIVLAIPIVGYLLGPALKKTSADNSWINLGPLSGFPEGETRLVIPAWVRRVSGETFQVFAINCAHLGCPVRWFAQSKLFLCPCHGGAYYADGSRASGPPERGLFEYQHKISNGTLMISAGRMPTLANEATNVTPLTQIDTRIKGSSAAKLSAIDQPQPRCSSCQT
jgi:menaquinol-cytochrome c reductase iron-sulfur subunit